MAAVFVALFDELGEEFVVGLDAHRFAVGEGGWTNSGPSPSRSGGALTAPHKIPAARRSLGVAAGAGLLAQLEAETGGDVLDVHPIAVDGSAGCSLHFVRTPRTRQRAERYHLHSGVCFVRAILDRRKAIVDDLVEAARDRDLIVAVTKTDAAPAA